MEYELSKIAEILNAEISGNKNQVITEISLDSRNIISSSNILFFCIKGVRHNAHEFIVELINKGIKNFVVSEKNVITPEANFLLVPNTLKALQNFAASHRNKFNLPVIGITGSNGKTIVKEWLAQTLSTNKQVVRSPRSYNSQIGVPLSVLHITKADDLAIFEAGISQKGEMQQLKEIIFPTIGVFTNIGEAHSQGFSNIKEKTQEKLKLFKSCNSIFYNKDYTIIDDAIKNDNTLNSKKLHSISLKNDIEAELRLLEKIKVSNSTLLKVKYNDILLEYKIPFTDDASIENSMLTCLVLLNLGITIQETVELLSHLQPIAMRLEVKKANQGSILINDTYNSDLGSLSIALDYLEQQSHDLNKTLIISDFLQSGQPDEILYKEVAKKINAHNIKKLIGIGSKVSLHKYLFDCEGYYYNNTSDFLSLAKRSDFANQAILVKGARSFNFDKITLWLEEKKHETKLEINVNALINNLNYFRSLLNPETKIMVMVKALGYGSGSYELAKILQHQKVDYLGVAYTDEGVDLRKNGISLPIMVMSPQPSTFHEISEYNLEPEIYSLSMLQQFSDFIKQNGLKDYPVHIKIETGMYRLGFMQNEIDDVIDFFKQNSTLRIKSVFSHLAGSDEATHDNFTKNQINLFKKFTEKIEQEIKYPFLKHILNSSGIERHTEAQFDMARLGIGLHSISTIENLQPVASLKSVVVQVKNVKKGETIGYSRKGKAVTDTKIGIIPIGYADGLSRTLSNGKGEMAIDGIRYPIIGNVCMDLCMIDITNSNVNEYDEVEIFGNNISIEELANKLDTIPYEILTSVSSRVKRVYIYD